MTLRRLAALLLDSQRWAENFKRLDALNPDADSHAESDAANAQATAILAALDRADARWMIAFLKRESAELKTLPPTDAAKHLLFGAVTFPSAGEAETAFNFMATAAEADAKQLEEKHQFGASARDAAAKLGATCKKIADQADIVLAEPTESPAAAPGTAAGPDSQPVAKIPKSTTPTKAVTSSPNKSPAPMAPKKALAATPAKPVVTTPTKSGSGATPTKAVVATSGAPTGGASHHPGDVFSDGQASGLVPASATPGRTVTEADLASLIRRVQAFLDSPKEGAVTVSNPKAPVSRVQAVAALMKLAMSRDEIASSQGISEDSLLPDFKQTPAWGRPFVTAAIAQDWWPAAKTFTPNGVANWFFVATILEKMPLAAAAPPTGAAVTAPGKLAPEAGAYTGLVIDARALLLKRDAFVRILDPSGAQIYPDPKALPGETFQHEHGLADYITDLAQAKRAGANPLVEKAEKTVNSDIYVSAEVAARLRAADQKGHFVPRWAVAILGKDN